jgi:hypothetical protein
MFVIAQTLNILVVEANVQTNSTKDSHAGESHKMLVLELFNVSIINVIVQTHSICQEQINALTK